MSHKTIWFDIGNTPHVNFFKPIVSDLSTDNKLVFSVNDFAETVPLFKKEIGSSYQVIGFHRGGNKIAKVYGMLSRTLMLMLKMPYFDAKVSIGGDASNYVAKLRGKKSITFDDNETSFNDRYSKFTDCAFWPKAIPLESLLKQGFSKDKIYQYHGYKEDVYVADFHPDPEFLSLLPFDQYVVVRPENLQANYIHNNSVKPITPNLLKRLVEQGYNVLYLPRYQIDRDYSKGLSNVFIPDSPLNGLDVCYYSNAVLTGAGTFAREAACLGVPSFSFYAGKRLLTVDKDMIDKGKMFFSRDIDEILKQLSCSERSDVDISRSKDVKQEVISKLREVLSN